MKEETDLREVVVSFLQGENLFSGAAVPILGEEATGERERPCVTVEVASNGRLVPGMPIKLLKIEVLTQRNDTAPTLAAAWSQEVLAAIEQGSMEIATAMHERGWLIKGFSISDLEEEPEAKRAWSAALTWRVVLCSV
jgi:hypothetical protein